MPTEAQVAWSKGYSLLHVAAGLGREAGVAWLLEQKALDVNDVTEDERLSVLQCAVLGGNIAVVEKVLAAGANVAYLCAPPPCCALPCTAGLKKGGMHVCGRCPVHPQCTQTTVNVVRRSTVQLAS